MPSIIIICRDNSIFLYMTLITPKEMLAPKIKIIPVEALATTFVCDLGCLMLWRKECSHLTSTDSTERFNHRPL